MRIKQKLYRIYFWFNQDENFSKDVCFMRHGIGHTEHTYLNISDSSLARIIWLLIHSPESLRTKIYEKDNLILWDKNH